MGSAAVTLSITLCAITNACEAGSTPQDRKADSVASPAGATASSKPASRPDVEFVETITAGAEGREALPMIVAIHGLGDDPRHFASVLGGLTAKARIVLPRGLDRYNDGWSWFPFSRGDAARNAPGIENAANHVAKLLAWMQKNRRTIGKPVVTGFSQGGMITFELAVHHPEVVGSAYPMGGVLPEPLWPRSKDPNGAFPKILAFHGTEDPLVPLHDTELGVQRLRELGFSVELKKYEGTGHTVSAEMREELVRHVDTDCRALSKSEDQR